tara:strand:+ start:28139 stop:28612 length:474 start_codon:yes stop_codon:yes gene_type:complete
MRLFALFISIFVALFLGACETTPDGSVQTIGGALRFGDNGAVTVRSSQPVIVQTFADDGYQENGLQVLGPGQNHRAVLRQRSFGATQHTLWVTFPDGEEYILNIYRCRGGYRGECFVTDFTITLYEDYWTCAARLPAYNLSQCRVSSSGRLREHRYD